MLTLTRTKVILHRSTRTAATDLVFPIVKTACFFLLLPGEVPIMRNPTAYYHGSTARSLYYACRAESSLYLNASTIVFAIFNCVLVRLIRYLPEPPSFARVNRCRKGFNQITAQRDRESETVHRGEEGGGERDTTRDVFSDGNRAVSELHRHPNGENCLLWPTLGVPLAPPSPTSPSVPPSLENSHCSRARAPSPPSPPPPYSERE